MKTIRYILIAKNEVSGSELYFRPLLDKFHTWTRDVALTPRFTSATEAILFAMTYLGESAGSCVKWKTI